MKGISLAIETIIYLILAITVLSILLLFFLTQAGPAQDQYTLQAKRDRFCGTYTSLDFGCKGRSEGGTVQPVPVGTEVLNGIRSACVEMKRRFGYPYSNCDTSDYLKCIQQCCLTCPQPK